MGALLLGASVSMALAALVSLPFLLRGEVGVMVAALSQNVGNYAALSANAHNLWWLVAGGDVWRNDAALALGPLTYRGVGLLLLGPALLWSLAHLRPRSDAATIFAVAATLQLSLFTWPTEVHESWVFTAFAPLCVAAALRPPLRPFYVLLSLTFLINLGLEDLHLQPLWEAQDRAALLDRVRALNALAYVALTLALMGTLRRIRPTA